MDNKGIVLNRMDGSGEYLHTNLGHEIINFFQADNDNHYLYLNATGNFAKEHKNKIGHMLFVKYYDKGIVEVIGMATGLEDIPGANMPLKRDKKFKEVDENIWKHQIDFINNEEVCYGGKSILDIFSGAEQQSIFITYKAEKVYRIKSSHRIFICFSSVNSDANLPIGGIVIKLSEINQAKTSLKQYIYPSDSKDNYKVLKELIVVKLSEITQAKTSLKQYIYPSNSEKDYEALKKLIDDEYLWESVGKVDLDQYKASRQMISLFDICQIQNNENCFSNALAYFMMQPQYYELWVEFFEKFKIDEEFKINLDKDFSVEREASAKIEEDHNEEDHNTKPSGGRIDLLIRDGKNIIVIENKIKSDINSVAKDKFDCNQLDRYVNYIEWLKSENEKGHFILLTPNYNVPTLKEEMQNIYKIVTYGEVYDFLSQHKFKFENDLNFVAFFNAIKRHTFKTENEYYFQEMMEKFYRRLIRKS